MSTFPIFDSNNLEQISRILGEAVTGSQLSDLLNECGIVDNSNESTKWRRIYHSLINRQGSDRCGNSIAAFIKKVLDPVRFRNNQIGFDLNRQEMNVILAFNGLEYEQTGNFRSVTAATTISEAERRVRKLNIKLHGRRIHPEVVKYCNTELLQDNYFHAVFEAAKGLAQRIREKSGTKSDGARLIDDVFLSKCPKLAINTLQTDTERSEHMGFAMLLKGCFSAIRNPLAHEPKILWDGDDDAADYLSLISLLHYKLDDSVLVPIIKEGHNDNIVQNR